MAHVVPPHDPGAVREALGMCAVRRAQEEGGGVDRPARDHHDVGRVGLPSPVALDLDRAHLPAGRAGVEFGDQLVSENLAKILAKQGKTEKAIDIYKKLVWKFPQKKAYFASQIESLKEK